MSNNSPIQKYDYLDWLRGFAIFGTIFVHVGSIFDIKWLVFLETSLRMGVPLFFIISAYTLSLSFNSRLQNENKPIKNFYIRRFFRIYPLFFIMTIIIFFLCYYDILPGELNISDLFTHLTFTFGFLPITVNNMYMGEWSLFNEVVFYLFFPFLFLSIRNSRVKFIFLILLLSFIVSYGVNILNYLFIPQDSVYYGFVYSTILTTFYPFVLGITLFKIKDIYIREKYLKILSYINIIGFLVLVCLNMKFGLFFFPFFYFNLALMVFLFIKGRYSIKNKFLSKFFKFAGEISYSAYLLNISFFILYGKYILENVLRGRIIFIIFAVIMLLFISFLTYKFIEQPGIKLGKRIINKISK